MHRPPSLAAAALFAAAAIVLSACGGESATTGEAAKSSDSTTSSTKKSDQTVTVLRSGGIAGVRDAMRIAADGTATMTSRNGTKRTCTPPKKALERLRAVDLAAVATAPTEPPGMADGFTFAVASGGVTAEAGEGDDDSRRAELVDAAAAVVASCLAG